MEAPRRFPVALTKENIGEFMQQVDTVVCDCDGVIWLSKTDLPNAREALKSLRKCGKKIYFVSNNSVHPTRERLDRPDFPVREDEVMVPAFAIARALQQRGFTKKAYVQGVEYFKDVIRAAGIRVVPEKRNGVLLEESVVAVVNALYTDPEVGAVIFDVDLNLTYSEMNNTANFLRNPDCLFIAGAIDNIITHSGGNIYLGPGSFLKALEGVTGRKPDETFGKPAPVMVELLKDIHNIDLSRAVFVGDTLEQDMGVANACGMKKLLVLTGVTPLHELDTCDPELIPDFTIKSLGDFVDLLS